MKDGGGHTWALSKYLLGNYTHIWEQQPTKQRKFGTRLSAVRAYQADSAIAEQLNHACERQLPCSHTRNEARAQFLTYAPLITDCSGLCGWLSLLAIGALFSKWTAGSALILLLHVSLLYLFYDYLFITKVPK